MNRTAVTKTVESVLEELYERLQQGDAESAALLIDRLAHELQRSPTMDSPSIAKAKALHHQCEQAAFKIQARLSAELTQSGKSRRAINAYGALPDDDEIR